MIGERRPVTQMEMADQLGLPHSGRLKLKVIRSLIHAKH